MTISFKLPILSHWHSTLQRWAAELRPAALLRAEDFTWQRWDPVVTKNTGAGSLDSIDTKYAQYAQVGKIIWVALEIGISVTGTVTEIHITPPVAVGADTAPNMAGVYPFAGYVNDGGTLHSCMGKLTPTRQVIIVQRHAGASFTDSSIGLTGVYKSV